jgi:hypothetical protein
MPCNQKEEPVKLFAERLIPAIRPPAERRTAAV